MIDHGKFGWDKVCELGDALAGKHASRTDDRQIIYYKSNTSVGIQFAAAGALIYEACRKAGLGRELPTEWFGADVSEWPKRATSLPRNRSIVNDAETRFFSGMEI